MVAPAIILMCLLLLGPLLGVIALSFTDYQLGSPTFAWIGLENYREMLADRVFWTSLRNTLTYVAIVVPSAVALGLGIALLILDRWRLKRTSWRAAALLVGALLGLYFQFVQTMREGLMMDAIRQYNRADVVFTGMLPFADDPRALLAEIGIDPGCAIYDGRRAWELPDLPEHACSGLVNFTRGREIGALIRHPAIAAKLAAHGVSALDPWIADNVGHVEGAAFRKLPNSIPSLGRVLHASAVARYTLLALPFLGLIVLLVRPGVRRGSAALDATALVVVTMLGTLAVTLLGDGLADTAKQGHLVVNAALAWLAAGLMMRAPAIRTTVRTIGPPGDASLPPR